MRAYGIGAVAVVLGSLLLTGCGSSTAAQTPAAVPVHHVGHGSAATAGKRAARGTRRAVAARAPQVRLTDALVKTASPGSLTVLTSQGAVVTVVIGKRTRLVSSGTALTFSELSGRHVTVVGHRLADGSIRASSVAVVG